MRRQYVRHLRIVFIVWTQDHQWACVVESRASGDIVELAYYDCCSARNIGINVLGMLWTAWLVCVDQIVSWYPSDLSSRPWNYSWYTDEQISENTNRNLDCDIMKASGQNQLYHVHHKVTVSKVPCLQNHDLQQHTWSNHLAWQLACRTLETNVASVSHLSIAHIELHGTL